MASRSSRSASRAKALKKPALNLAHDTWPKRRRSTSSPAASGSARPPTSRRAPRTRSGSGGPVRARRRRRARSSRARRARRIVPVERRPAGSAASSSHQVTAGSAPSSVVTRVQITTRSWDGSPLATPWRKIGPSARAHPTSRWTEMTSLRVSMRPITRASCETEWTWMVAVTTAVWSGGHADVGGHDVDLVLGHDLGDVATAVPSGRRPRPGWRSGRSRSGRIPTRRRSAG